MNPVFILDEPTAGVDVELRRGMWDYLTGLSKSGLTILLTTHYLEEAEQLAKHVAIINKGQIVANGTMDEILALHDESAHAYAASAAENWRKCFCSSRVKNNMSPYQKWISFYTMLRKDIVRMFRIWVQTFLPSVITSCLYFLIFGTVLGSKIGTMQGVDYMSFVVPGLVMLAIVTNAYSNTSFTFFQSKFFFRGIDEILVSPLRRGSSSWDSYQAASCAAYSWARLCSSCRPSSRASISRYTASLSYSDSPSSRHSCFLSRGL